MANIRKPRKGSMQYWPRKRAVRQYPLVKSWANVQEPKLLGFAGYKAGMFHIIVTDNRKTSPTKGQDISIPVTVLECPPLKVASVRFYKTDVYGKKAAKDIMAKVDKELGRRISMPKKIKEDMQKINPSEYDDMTLLVYTQPKLTGIGKKVPEIFEVAIGGDMKTKFEFAKNVFGKEITVEDVFKEGQNLDVHAVTKGKGFQGPVKRFGVSLRSHKSEKTKRGPGSLGGWRGQGHVMYRVAHAGQMGYHTRMEHNKMLIKIEKDLSRINPKGGFNKYGVIRNTCLLMKGSLPGPSKRLIRLCRATRDSKSAAEAPAIQQIIN